MTEQPVLFGNANSLVGVVTMPTIAADLGIVILVGGRQYRAGSHRQFVRLARRLASADFCSLRFDFSGMGDSAGARSSFEDVHSEIAIAIDELQTRCPSVSRIVLWGLCDGATAAVLYWQRVQDPRITGMCLINPWMRSESGLARTRVRHYYGQRLVTAQFWRNLIRGEVGLFRALGEFLSNWQLARVPNSPASYQLRVLHGLQHFPGKSLLMLSGRDLTAREFIDTLADDPIGQTVLANPRMSRVDVEDADHTFSTRAGQSVLEDTTLSWLKLL